MTLTNALDSARSGLSVASDQINVVSRNISNQSTSGSTRKTANVIADGGNIRIASITRASNSALQSSLLSSTSDAGQQSAIAAALKQLDPTVGDTQDDTSITALIGKFNTALQSYSTSPNDAGAAQAALGAASNLVSGLNDASKAVTDVRAQADANIAGSVSNINSLLSRFTTVNQAIVAGSQTGADITDNLDARDQILQQLSTEVGIRTVSRDNNDLAIYTDSGVTLFDKSARSVTFNATNAYGPNTTGQAVYADGVPITSQGSALSVHSGRLVGLTTVRDDLAPTYQKQLDEVARGLVSSFAEQDQSGTVPAQADRAGLFTYSGAPTVPASGTAIKGLASDIKIASSVDPSKGGNINLLRDGGISSNGAAPYSYNAAGAQGFTARLNQLIGNLSTTQTFDPSAKASTSASVSDFASSSVSWLENARQTASNASDYRTTLQQKASDALSNDTGINLDSELSKLLSLEQSYQASAKLVTTISNLYQSLFEAVR